MARAIRASGLVVEAHLDWSLMLRLPVVTDPRQLTFGADDVVPAGHEIARLRGTALGVLPVPSCRRTRRSSLRAERRRDAGVLDCASSLNVYGVECDVPPTGYLTPWGVVTAYSAPIAGILDLGRSPALAPT